MEGMEFCTDQAKQIFEAYQSSMVDKYGEDTTQYPLGDVELWEHASGGRRFSIGSSDIHFVVTGTQGSSGSIPFYGLQHEM
ncbi:hypothetical protein L1987_84127 [Smallanthus sonchifolius]|uniref:Uncharacterized protein n=1 Tax=Smallanthus sonchifolius TaxID=185202 RepID=A0ACB8YE15_9ASTR|nr:hypothetical protein L1987_84127 [Smallanthus sonchifolius]